MTRPVDHTADQQAAQAPDRAAAIVEADRRTIRRALRAGVLTALALGLLTVVGSTLSGGDGRAAAVWVASAVVVGMLVSAGWLVLAMILDLSAGVVPTRRRIVWTVGVFALAFVAPILPAAALQVAASG